ncbi:hypothetical protein FACHB389_29740 [Nostoc calcicola FACHB-389]|nr:hypothetical protein FACHB389_29740 [Nostoc calcicola FACHB-389]
MKLEEHLQPWDIKIWALLNHGMIEAEVGTQRHGDYVLENFKQNLFRYSCLLAIISIESRLLLPQTD